MVLLKSIPACLADHDLSTFEAPALLPFPANQPHGKREEVCTIRGWSRGMSMSQEGELAGEHEHERNGPIWVLLHGFPQTWRHFIKFLPASTRLFVPDLPGYGHSSPLRTPSHDKSTVGRAILASLNAVLTSAKPPHRNHDIILLGHDRGARVAHRLAVDAASYADIFTLQAVSLIDIVPTLVQWQAMADPREAAVFWHWPFLANIDVAMDMVARGEGGAVFARKMMERLAGGSPLARANLYSDGAMEVYELAFRQESVLRAACKDYEAGAGVDVAGQREDQREGRKIEVPVLVLFSGDGLGKRFDVEREWKAWVGESLLRAVAMGEGVGHHLVEEAAEAASAAVNGWIDSI